MCRVFLIWMSLVSVTVAVDDPVLIWAQSSRGNQTIYLRKNLQLSGEVKRAAITVNCDDRSELWLNGEYLGKQDGFTTKKSFDLTTRLRPGKNLLAAKAYNGSGSAGFIAWFEVEYHSGPVQAMASSPDWLSSEQEHAGWEKPEYDDAAWKPAKVASRIGETSWTWLKLKWLCGHDRVADIQELDAGLGNVFHLRLDGGDPLGPFDFKTGQLIRIAGSAFILETDPGQEPPAFRLKSKRTGKTYGMFTYQEGSPVMMGRMRFSIVP